MPNLLVDRIDSPIGEIIIVVENNRLCALDYTGYEARMFKLLQQRYENTQLQESPDPCGFSSLLRAYLAGDFNCLNSILVNPGGTPFQQMVWAALRDIPAGEVASYGKVAAKLGKPNAARAVGLANSLNPIAIVIPCHRVIGANATLTGYAGGLERKRWLLQHEKAILKPLMLDL
ncbi:MAG: methylated-DNA--[protein]-cysteine S-methyltransferase [Chloroflexi bacterium]|uniref:Methylated-DNA--protein-cysteine methyltransferase n=1 Tax=Candidatus Chlorohelix allophototropha TaxID=3003348 RepID=A0A8T7LQW8_9CHLR|nr:methylated-DNA--[protein]-cysteine S-methyltransferase [Chloroflexota bacterium]WJW66325.1 methylated-DNA--[protein]-cysteine S-methyltransferase [Chloroflexota bacterium L227-S17]